MEYPSIAPSIPLAGGTSIPAVGLGVFRSACGTETEQAVTWALEAGYRHIDTAVYVDRVLYGRRDYLRILFDDCL